MFRRIDDVPPFIFSHLIIHEADVHDIFIVLHREGDETGTG